MATVSTTVSRRPITPKDLPADVPADEAPVQAQENGRFPFYRLCKMLGKPSGYVRVLQSALQLYLPRKGEGYTNAYAAFLERVVSLRAFSVAVEDICDLFGKEKKILELLHVDSIANSPTWYLDACDNEQPHTERHLLLTGYDLGFPLGSDVIQSNLDFGRRDDELFTRHEMGEDIRRMLRLYLKLLMRVRERVTQEKPVLERALFWSEEAFWGDRAGL